MHNCIMCAQYYNIIVKYYILKQNNFKSLLHRFVRISLSMRDQQNVYKKQKSSVYRFPKNNYRVHI